MGRDQKPQAEGPMLVVLVLMGYAAGLSLAYADHGQTFTYPLHSVTGSVIALSLVGIYSVSSMDQGHRVRLEDTPLCAGHCDHLSVHRSNALWFGYPVMNRKHQLGSCKRRRR